MDKTIDKKKFMYMQRWSLENAPITNDDLSDKVDQFHKELSNDKSLTKEKYLAALDKKMADYLFSTYQSLVLTQDEKVVGINDNERIELFDATDTKAHYDLW
jgi:predicted HAD superfamily Cof-like phosphohydrolase